MGWREVRRLTCTGHPTQVWRNLCKKDEDLFFFIFVSMLSIAVAQWDKKRTGCFIFNRNKGWSKSQKKKIQIYTDIWINVEQLT